MEYTTLNTGAKMPYLGLGVFQLADLAECERVVDEALAVGYRLIDTAQGYGNERAVGKAIRAAGLPRAELFVTTKVWVANNSYEGAKASIGRSLERLGLDYLDLLLIHHPFSDYYGAYRALQEAFHAGTLRAIGVSNFYPDHLADLVAFNEVVPAVNQVETHVFCQQRAAKAQMEALGVQIEAWAPFAEGRDGFFGNPTLAAVGAKYAKTPAQVALRFLIQSGVVVIPKTAHPARLAENFAVFDFALDADDLAAISALDTGQRLLMNHYDPATVQRFKRLVEERKDNPEIN
ncbi:MAG: aldo/keto reductase [Propionibacteriaceae bacterium]|jgi:diketogulonate reductase-like aldo/keto reductase|nr:aldo/keto reductase [Propionibacteriaceae bacterium]